MKTKQFVFNLISVGLLFSACGRKQFVTNFEHTAPPPTPQYSDLKNWAAHPDKHDNADSVPLNSGLHDDQATAEVDVFFVHPTTYTTQKGEIHWNGSLEDAALNLKTDNGRRPFSKGGV